MRDRIGGVEIAVAEIAVQSAVEVVGAGLGLHVHLHARRPAQGGVEAVGDDLKLVDGVLAVLRLAESVAGGVLGHLLAVDVDLQFAAIGRAERRIGHVVAGDARHHHGQLQIVAPVQRHLADLRRTDVAGNRGSVRPPRQPAASTATEALAVANCSATSTVAICPTSSGERPFRGSEPGRLEANHIRRCAQGRELIDALRIRDRLDLGAIVAGGGHNDGIDAGGGGVGDASADPGLLGERQPGGEGKCQCELLSHEDSLSLRKSALHGSGMGQRDREKLSKEGSQAADNAVRRRA